jgi:hypothetical protein
MDAEDVDLIVLAVLPILLPEPVPQHNSILTGSMYYAELLETKNEARFRSVVRMDLETFERLLRFLQEKAGLDNSKFIEDGQKLMIFIHILVGHSVRQTAERWQHSTSTISTVVHEIAACFQRVQKYLFVPVVPTEVPFEIRTNEKLTPFFDNCIGALDGTHIPVVAPVADQGPFRNRKGVLTQNVLGVVNFDGTFSYSLAGWEGSASDSRVLGDALTKGLRTWPIKYYLGDAGYANKRYCMTPYRGVRYHLKEWRLGRARPQNREELFNLRHSSLRNVVERVFGIAKKRFPILVNMHSFEIAFQILLVNCCFMIHNFIRKEQHYEDEYDNWSREEEDHQDVVDAQEEEEENQDDAMLNLRDQIAEQMWVAYQQYIAQQV